MSRNFIATDDLNLSDWVAVVECPGPDEMDIVLGFVVSNAEQTIRCIPRRVLLDELDLFIDSDIPVNVSIEYTTIQSYYENCGDRMPLGNTGFRI